MTFEPEISIALELATGSLWDYALKIPYQQRIEMFPEVFNMAIKCLSEFQSCNLVHGDIKTQNMLAWWDPKASSPTFRQLCRIVLTDFGLTSSRPDFDDSIYTPGFRAPELYKGKHIVANKETDVYAMGKTLIDFLFKNTYLDPWGNPSNIPDDIVQFLRNIPHGDEVLTMVSYNPDDRPRMDIHIFTWPKRQWGFIRDDIFDGIVQETWKQCKKYKLSNATFVQTIDLILRCTFIDRDRFVGLNFEATACLLIASYWGEYDAPKFKYMDLILNDMKQILEMIKGLVYLPNLEYMQNLSLEEMVTEFQSKMIR
jgi:serine/threonine protein kinase